LPEDYAKLLSADLLKWIKRLMSDYENWTATTLLDKYGLFFGLPPALGSITPASGFHAKNALNSSYVS